MLGILLIFFSACKGSENIIPGNPPSHPRILLPKGEEDLIDQNIRADKEWLDVSSFILDKSDAMIDLPPVERVLIGRRQ